MTDHQCGCACYRHGHADGQRAGAVAERNRLRQADEPADAGQAMNLLVNTWNRAARHFRDDVYVEADAFASALVALDRAVSACAGRKPLTTPERAARDD